MNVYTPLEYVKIAVANAFGLDNLLFPERLEWFEKTEGKWKLVKEAKEPYQFIKALYAYDDILQGIPTGYCVGLDATSSGMQLMSLLIGCPITARQCNVINTGKRENAYQNIYKGMLEENPHLDYPAGEIKTVGMTVLYASKAEPRKLFGTGETLDSFYRVIGECVPGALELMDDILDCRDPKALGYSWKLPDMHTAKTKIMVTQEVLITVPELEDIPVKHLFSINKENKRSVSLVADIVHSTDGFITREFNLRCNYNKGVILRKLALLETQLPNAPTEYWDNVPSITRLLDLHKGSHYKRGELFALKRLANKILEYKPFDTFVVHDKFFSSPIHMQRVRETVHSIYCEIADSNMMSDILNQITGRNVGFTKITEDLSTKMQDAEYILS